VTDTVYYLYIYIAVDSWMCSVIKYRTEQKM